MRSFKSLILILASILATACSKTLLIPEDFSAEKYPTDGVLLVSTSLPHFNEEAIFYFRYTMERVQEPGAWKKRFLKNEGVKTPGKHERHSFDIYAVQSRENSDFEDVDGRVSVVALKEGKYKVTGWVLSIPAGMGGQITYRPDPPLEPIYFEVHPGKITYLGNIHMLNTFRKRGMLQSNVAQGGPVEFFDMLDRDLAVMQKKLPQISLPVVKQVPGPGYWSLMSHTQSSAGQ